MLLGLFSLHVGSCRKLLYFPNCVISKLNLERLAMYLNKLSETEKNAFFSIAQAIASVHEGVSLQEKAILEAALGEMRISHPGELMSVGDALSKIESPESKRIVLLELMLIALVDDDFALEEQAVIEEVIKGLNLSEAHIERAATWAGSTLALFRSGQRFIEFA